MSGTVEFAMPQQCVRVGEGRIKSTAVSIFGDVMVRIPRLVAFGFGCRHIVFDEFRQSLVVNPEGKWRERNISDIDRLDGAGGTTKDR